MTFFFAFKLAMSFVFLPGAISLYIEEYKIINNPTIRLLTYSNKYFWITFSFALILIGSETYSYSITIPDDSKDNLFCFFRSTDFERELEIKKLLNPYDKKELVRKFEHIDYAWDKKDYDEVLYNLSQIEQGKDNRGQLPQLKSFVVYNDLGCVHFKVHRNREFTASSYLAKAKELSTSETPFYYKIDKNIKLLDTLVNKRD